MSYYEIIRVFPQIMGKYPGYVLFATKPLLLVSLDYPAPGCGATVCRTHQSLESSQIMDAHIILFSPGDMAHSSYKNTPIPVYAMNKTASVTIKHCI